jgi:O-antigen/teichoic acid export membrane protein
MKHLLRLTAIIEAATGLALMAVPSVVVRLLLGDEISGASIPLGRVAGLGLLSLGMACWPGCDATGNTAPALRAMLTYNSLVTLYLLCLGIGGQWVGPLLWPAVALHGILSLLLARQWRLGDTGQ